MHGKCHLRFGSLWAGGLDNEEPTTGLLLRNFN